MSALPEEYVFVSSLFTSLRPARRRLAHDEKSPNPWIFFASSSTQTTAIGKRTVSPTGKTVEQIYQKAVGQVRDQQASLDEVIETSEIPLRDRDLLDIAGVALFPLYANRNSGVPRPGKSRIHEPRWIMEVYGTLAMTGGGPAGGHDCDPVSGTWQLFLADDSRQTFDGAAALTLLFRVIQERRARLLDDDTKGRRGPVTADHRRGGDVDRGFESIEPLDLLRHKREMAVPEDPEELRDAIASSFPSLDAFATHLEDDLDAVFRNHGCHRRKDGNPLVWYLPDGQDRIAALLTMATPRLGAGGEVGTQDGDPFIHSYWFSSRTAAYLSAPDRLGSEQYAQLSTYPFQEGASFVGYMSRAMFHALYAANYSSDVRRYAYPSSIGELEQLATQNEEDEVRSIKTVFQTPLLVVRWCHKAGRRGHVDGASQRGTHPAIAMNLVCVATRDIPPLLRQDLWELARSLRGPALAAVRAQREHWRINIRDQHHAALAEAEALSHEAGQVIQLLRVSKERGIFAWHEFDQWVNSQPDAAKRRRIRSLVRESGAVVLNREVYEDATQYLDLASDSKTARTSFDNWAGRLLLAASPEDGSENGAIVDAVEFALRAAVALWARSELPLPEADETILKDYLETVTVSARRRASRRVRFFNRRKCVYYVPSYSLQDTVARDEPSRNAADEYDLVPRWLSKLLTAALLNTFKHAISGEAEVFAIDPVAIIFDHGVSTRDILRATVLIANATSARIPEREQRPSGTRAALNVYAAKLRRLGLEVQIATGALSDVGISEDELDHLDPNRSRTVYKTELTFEGWLAQALINRGHGLSVRNRS